MAGPSPELEAELLAAVDEATPRKAEQGRSSAQPEARRVAVWR